MKNNKKAICLAITAAILSTSVTPAFAKVVGYVTEKDGVLYQYDKTELKSSIIGDGALYAQYNDGKLKALLDDKNGYIDANDVRQYIINEDKIDVDAYTESDKAEKSTITEAEVKKVDKDGNVIEKPVEEGLKVESVSAINSTQAEVKFSKAVKEVKPANFKVTDKDGNLVFVSKVELNEAKDVATLTFVSKFADKATYNVEISNVADVDGNLMEKATEAFTYVAAEVAKVEFTQTTVGYDSDLKKVVKVTDKLGRDVTSEHNIEFESSNTTMIPATGLIGKPAEDGSAIVVAKVKVSDNWVKSAPTTINVKKSAPATFVGAYVYTGNPAADTEKFAELKDEEKINYVYENDSASKLALYYNDQYGNKLGKVDAFNDTDKPALENLTPAVVVVKNDGTITPVSVGEGYVKVTNGDVVTTVKIVVREKSKITTMELEKTNVSVVAGKASETVKVTFKDQFGTKKDVTPTEAKPEASTIATAVPGVNSVVINGVEEGTTTVEVSYKVDDKTTLKETINVTVEKAADLATYKAETDATKLDVKGVNNDDEKLPKSTNIVVYEIDANGNKLDPATAELTEVDKDGKEIKEEDKKLLTITDNKKVEAKAAGTAYVQVKVGSLVIDTLEFEVVNTESTATTVEFDRNDLAYVANYDENKFSFKLAGSANKYTHEELKKDLATIIKVKDQYGEIMDAELTIDPLFTNLNGLKLDSTGVKLEDVTKATATLDIVVKEIKVGNGDNLISEPVVIKVAVDAKEALEAKKVAEEKKANTEAVNEAKDKVEAEDAFKDHGLKEASVTKDVAAAKVKEMLKTLVGEDVTTELTEETFEAATDYKAADESGDPAEVQAKDGSYKFKVKISKGEGEAKAEVTTKEITITIPGKQK